MLNEDQGSVIERLVRALNEHDIERVVACFAQDYALEAPAHPMRSFRGTEQVRRNWTQIFATVPDISTRVLRSVVDGDAVWTEMEMSGNRRDGGTLLMRGVFIFGVAAGQVRWGRMFLEPVEQSSGDMNALLREQLARPSAGSQAGDS